MNTITRPIISSILIFSITFGSIASAATEESSHRSSSSVAENDTDEDGSGTQDPNAGVSPGFLIHLNSPDDGKLTGDYRVSIDGKLNLPYNISVNAAGLKLKALETRIATAYQPYFKVKPRLEAEIKQKRYWIKVLGLVKNPGSYLIKERATLDEALGLADVRTEDLPNGFVRFEQAGKKRWISMEDYLKGGKAHDIPSWQGRELIVFQMERPEGTLTVLKEGDEEVAGPSARKVQVLGEVNHPGGVSFQQSADGYYYLIQRGGPTRDADLAEVELLRKDKKTNEHVQVAKGNMREIKDIRESDILMVYPNRPSTTERTLQNTALVAGIVSAAILTFFVVVDR